jgi:hypothetical protein
MADEALLPVETGADEFELETPELETPDADVTENTEDDETEGESEEATETPEDGRKFPDAVRKALKEFRESNPANAKAAEALKNSFGRDQAYKAVFPEPADAVKAHATLQELGGYEGGVDGIKTTLAEVEEIDALLAAGDPACLDRLQEIAGEGLNKLAPEILNRMKASNPTAYADVLRPIVSQAVAAAGYDTRIEAIWSALQNARRSDAPESFKNEAQDEADLLIKDLYKNLKALGTAAEPVTKANPATEALTAREKAIQDKENQFFDAEVGKITDTEFQKGLLKEFNPYFDKLKLNQAQKDGLVSDFWADVTKMCSADKVYLKNLNAAKSAKARTPDKVAAVVNAKFSAIVAQVAKSVVTKRYPQGAKSAVVKPAVKPAAAAGVGTLAKPILVKEVPERSQIDFTKTTEDMLSRSIRVLKTGKVVKVAS